MQPRCSRAAPVRSTRPERGGARGQRLEPFEKRFIRFREETGEAFAGQQHSAEIAGEVVERVEELVQYRGGPGATVVPTDEARRVDPAPDVGSEAPRLAQVGIASVQQQMAVELVAQPALLVLNPLLNARRAGFGHACMQDDRAHQLGDRADRRGCR